jgi:hypothetical protein
MGGHDRYDADLVPIVDHIEDVPGLAATGTSGHGFASARNRTHSGRYGDLGTQRDGALASRTTDKRWIWVLLRQVCRGNVMMGGQPFPGYFASKDEKGLPTPASRRNLASQVI